VELGEASQALVTYDAAKTALANAVKVDDVKTLRNKAHAIAAYARQAQDSELLAWAVEIKVRAERRAGELLREMPKHTGAKGIGPIAVPKSDRNAPPTLTALGISKTQSSLWQRVAALPGPLFEQRVAQLQARGGHLSIKSVLTSPVPGDEQEKPQLVDDCNDTLAKLRKRWPDVPRAKIADILEVLVQNVRRGLL
jgi:hypothetical protein